MLGSYAARVAAESAATPAPSATETPGASLAGLALWKAGLTDFAIGLVAAIALVFYWDQRVFDRR